ncbi:MAG: thiamine pyrophosphate-dependent dehydrogenase E1 component subunit alpha [Myxococcota bacterium]|jgi:pyruvate dehydrogenase E1 component alpha subunit
MNLSKARLIRLYRSMVRIRECEESFVPPILDGSIRCPAHLYTGEEAVAAGVCANLKRTDAVFGTHRSHGHFLAMGGSMKALVAELYGKRSGCSRGRGGSMHITDPRVGFIGAAPIVAGTISLTTGAGLAFAASGGGRVAVCFFGDGATGEGALYESMNFAAVRRLPVLFVCENNYYSTHLPIRECRVKDTIAEMAVPIGMASASVDGNDVLEVLETARRAVEGCRAGEGPFFLECRTYRMRGHVGPDDNVQGTHTDIRPASEIEAWRERDPLKLFRDLLLKEKDATAAELKKVKKDALKEVAEAHRAAIADRYPDPRELKRYVFKDQKA